MAGGMAHSNPCFLLALWVGHSIAVAAPPPRSDSSCQTIGADAAMLNDDPSLLQTRATDASVGGLGEGCPAQEFCLAEQPGCRQCLAGEPSVPGAKNTLARLVGSWEGTGFALTNLPQLISPPSGINVLHGDLLTLRDNYTESLTFTALPDQIPNRGLDPPINARRNTNQVLNGVAYLQIINRTAPPHDNMHYENGQYMTPIDTEVPANWSAMRMGSIPHGTTIMALGSITDGVAFDKARENELLQDEYSTHAAGPLGKAALIDTNAACPYNSTGDILPPCCVTPEDCGEGGGGGGNLRGSCHCNGRQLVTWLHDEIKCLKILYYMKISLRTADGGGIVNQPFIKEQAEVSNFTSTLFFFVVQDSDGKVYELLQYVQSMFLKFAQYIGVFQPTALWPHVLMNTLWRKGKRPPLGGQCPSPSPCP